MRRLVAFVLLCACATSGPPARPFPTLTKYPVTVTRHTPAGVAVDDPKGELADAVIDAAFAAVEACLAAKPRELTSADTAMWGGMYCHASRVPLTIDRRSLTVKVAPDWHVSACGTGQELFPCGVGSGDCAAKGITATAECPCQCRHAIQRGNVLVVTPAALLLRAAIVEAATGCENPWAGSLKECTH